MLQIIADPCADVSFLARRLFLGADRVRRTRCYCVGTAKSGTHSIAKMFSKNVRAGHEADAGRLLQKLIDRHHGRVGEEDLADWVRQRDRRRALEVDSSNLNFEILDILLREFSDARFVLTIRDCYSWLNSQLNHNLRWYRSPWRDWRELQAGPDGFIYAPGEELLRQNEFPNLDTLLLRWARHNAGVLAKVPAARLFVVKTHEISAKAFAIADFAGLPRRAVRLNGTHAFKNPAKQEIVRQLDRDLLEGKVEQHCRPLMTRFFPEIKSLDEARL